ncbi:MAG TPA: PIN domain-containing protein [Ktedonobacterales bacterium]|nr:PIN domain-containing protein [Ktedonobacterales bacterium]
MTEYVLDTDTFIYLLKHDARVEASLRTVGDGVVALSVVTVAEVLHGAYYSADPANSLRETQALIKRFTVIPLDEMIADTFGQIKTNLRRSGQILADFDVLSGATAIASGRTLVSNNMQHFRRLQPLGLTLINWKS